LRDEEEEKQWNDKKNAAATKAIAVHFDNKHPCSSGRPHTNARLVEALETLVSWT